MFFRKKALLTKIETTYATDALPTGVANAILCLNVNITPMENEMIDRNREQAFFGHQAQLPVNTTVRLDYEVELVGSGTLGTAPAWGPLVRACAFAETISAGVSVAYNPISSAIESVTQYFNLDGVLHKLLGCRGSVSMKISAKGNPVFAFKTMGLYGGISDAVMPTQTLTAWKDSIAVNNANTSAFALHGYAGKLYDMNIDLATKLVHRNLVGTEDIQLTDREPAGDIVIEATNIATKDFWTISKAATLGALTITHGTVAGYKVKIDAPNVQLINPSYEDRDGFAAAKMGLRFMPGSSGNDELTITSI
ncbi:hypothetical protein EBAPG3_010540 [Nitrosospira lacus]|uniref:Uncharacterized protein n=1 Tax=Nitrosospira lacus TaxID=1288494 RepID=A0A1W6SQT4_9PROT|nr:phage tail tube protein [Nitrosospira lacus]ARO88180.1 hypothetical protein EBAPG3_010540 [Nitrosospira lacus]